MTVTHISHAHGRRENYTTHGSFLELRFCEICKESTGSREGQKTIGEGRGCKGSIAKHSSPGH